MCEGGGQSSWRKVKIPCWKITWMKVKVTRKSATSVNLPKHLSAVCSFKSRWRVLLLGYIHFQSHLTLQMSYSPEELSCPLQTFASSDTCNEPFHRHCTPRSSVSHFDACSLVSAAYPWVSSCWKTPSCGEGGHGFESHRSSHGLSRGLLLSQDITMTVRACETLTDAQITCLSGKCVLTNAAGGDVW